MKIEWIEQQMMEAERLITSQQVEQGIHILSNLLYEEPGYGNLHNHLGWAHLYFTGREDQAELHLTMAVRFNSAFAAPYLHLGSLYERQGRYDEAIDWLQRGLNTPQANRALYCEKIAVAYELKRDFRQAIHFYKEAMAASAGMEYQQFRQSIKRCRRKRWTLMFSG